MFFNFFLAIFFSGSIGFLWYRISEKIPELIAIPDEVIVARLHEDSARVRIFLLHARTFWREPRYREALWRFCEKIIQRTHILLMRMDNGLMSLLKKVRSYAGIANADGMEERVSADEEKKEAFYEQFIAAAEPPRANFASMDRSPHAMPSRIQEVRKRRTKTSLQA